MKRIKIARDFSLPQESRDLLHQEAQRHFKSYVEESPLHMARILMQYLQGIPYGFRECLKTGNYAPWPHEIEAHPRKERNCTSIIPEAFSLSSAYGLNPEIIQFAHFRYVSPYTFLKEDDPSRRERSHFALLLNIPERGQYLFDPFQHRFGRIEKRTKHTLQFADATYKKFAGKVFFEKIIPYSPEAFVAMMQRFREECASLEVLSATQKFVKDFPIGDAVCNAFISYNDDPTRIETRLYIERPILRDKVASCVQCFDAKGEVEDRRLHLSYARGRTWEKILDPEEIGVVSFETLEKIEKACRDGSIHQEGKAEQVLCFEEAIKEGSVEWRAGSLIIRTLYEAERRGSSYVYSAEEHEAFMRKLFHESLELFSRANRIGYENYALEIGLPSLGGKTLRELRKEKADADIEKEIHLERLNAFGALYRDHPGSFSEIVDKVIFQERVREEGGMERLNEMVERYGFDPCIGHAFLLADFAPYIHRMKKELLLEKYMPSLEKKVRARLAER